MNEAKLGTLPDENELRDAVHVAIVPVVAGEKLSPGERVGIVGGEAFGVDDLRGTKAIGIVDPFLRTKVIRGQRCWVALFPGSIVSIRHDWDHPEFRETEPSSEQDPIARSKAIIQAFADELGVNYEEVIDAATDHAATGEYWIQGGRFEGVQMPNEFWRHYERVTGKSVDMDDDETFFSCSC